jgi:hypothetical protein
MLMRGVGWIKAVAGISAVLMGHGVALAWTYTLADGNSSVVIAADGSTGMNNWQVDGQNQLYQQWYWYRVGSAGPEASLNNLPLLSATQYGASRLDTVYGNSQFNVTVSYSLLGGASGSGGSDIGEQIRIRNLTASPLSFHFFQYTDFDLGGSFLDDSVQLGRNLQGQFNEALQNKGNVHFSDVIISPGASHAQAGLSPTIYNSLQDGNPTTLSDQSGPVSGDATSAFQWDPVIPAGSSFNISIDKNVYIVPEPATGSLLSTGLIALGLWKRRPRAPR